MDTDDDPIFDCFILFLAGVAEIGGGVVGMASHTSSYAMVVGIPW